MKHPAWRTAILALALASWLPGQESVEEIVKRAPSRGKFPQASAVWVKAAQTFRLGRDGKKSEEYFRVLEVFSLTGREKFSDFRIPLDKNQDRVEVLLARTYKGNLTPVDVEKGAINDVTPPHLADADMYSNIIHRVLSFPAVDPGSCLAVQYQKESGGPEENLSKIVYFQYDEPLQQKELRVILPKEKSFKYRLIGLKTDFREETAGEEKTYTLAVADSAQIKPEEFMPPLGEISARAVFSTCADWEEACRNFTRSFEAAARPGADVEALVARLTRGASSPEEKIQRLFLFVVREVRNVTLPFGEGGTDVHDAGVVLRNRYGDWKDKSALLAALIRACGLEAYPVLASSRGIPVAEDVPCLEQFDCVLVGVPRSGDYLFLNPFAKDCRYGYVFEARGSRGLIVKPGAVEFRTIRGLPGRESVSRSEISGELDGQGHLRAKIASSVSGIFDLWARQVLMDKTEKERQDFFKEALNRLHEDTEAIQYSTSDLKDLGEPVEVRQEFLARQYGIYQGKIVLLNLPDIPYEFAGQGLTPRLAKRQYPLRVPDEMAAALNFTLKIPKHYRLLYMPEGFSWEKDYGSFSFAASFDSGRSELTVKRSYALKKRDIPVDQYDEFKRAMDAFNLPRNTLILLEKNK